MSVGDVGSTGGAGDGCSSFYAVYIPEGIEIPEDIIRKPYYTDRCEAIKVIRKIKQGRMKRFSSGDEASLFSSHGIADTVTDGSTDAASSSPITSAYRAPILVPTKPNGSTAAASLSSENAAYRGVKIQDLVQLRLAVERGDIQRITELIQSNPRYLVASGDTPTILQERYRYNALHSAALKGQTRAAEVILNYISDDKNFHRLYPTDKQQSRKRRVSYLLDLYLNTPDKGFNETPLHFASKYGHTSVVALLLNETLAKRLSRNKNGQTALDVACTRGGTAADKSAIQQLFLGQYYVPLYRSESDDTMPVVGEPWSPDLCENRLDEDVFRQELVDNDLVSALRTGHQNRLPSVPLSDSNSSPSLGQHEPRSSMVVKAIAGPMSPQQATEFRRNWRSPCRRRPGQGDTFSPSRVREKTPTKIVQQGEDNSSLLFSPRADPFKGHELVGRVLADEMSVPWLEFWDFLGCSVDLRSTGGLDKLEEYLWQRYCQQQKNRVAEDTKDSVQIPDPDVANTSSRASTKTPTKLPTESHSSYSEGNNSTKPAQHQCTTPAQTLILEENMIPIATDKLNTTDDYLSDMFNKLSLNSPISSADQHKITNSPTKQNGQSPHTSPNKVCDRVRDASDSPQTRSASPQSMPTKSTVYSRTFSLLECMVPTISAYLEPLRRYVMSPGRSTNSSTAVKQEIEDVDAVNEDKSSASLVFSTSPERSVADGSVVERCQEAKLFDGAPLFISGTSPSKTDMDVLKALQPVDIDSQAYPTISYWKNKVTSFPKEEQIRWATPVVSRHRSSLRRRRDNVMHRETLDTVRRSFYID